MMKRRRRDTWRAFERHVVPDKYESPRLVQLQSCQKEHLSIARRRRKVKIAHQDGAWKTGKFVERKAVAVALEHLEI